jgi:SAM-dependent methyltransferase
MFTGPPSSHITPPSHDGPDDDAGRFVSPLSRDVGQFFPSAASPPRVSDHVFSAEMADRLEDDTRFRFCSVDELVRLLGAHRDQRLLDVGSGTGFYTRELAGHVGSVCGLDLQPAMHEYHRETGLADGVSLVTGAADALPFADAAFDAAVSTMTFHEFVAPDSVAELERVVRPGGRLVVVDWARHGEGATGAPVGERISLGEAVVALDGTAFRLEYAAGRVETFVLAATRV